MNTLSLTRDDTGWMEVSCFPCQWGEKETDFNQISPTRCQSHPLLVSYLEFWTFQLLSFSSAIHLILWYSQYDFNLSFCFSTYVTQYWLLLHATNGLWFMMYIPLPLMPPTTCHSAKLNTGYVFSPASINSKTTQDFTFKSFSHSLILF